MQTDDTLYGRYKRSRFSNAKTIAIISALVLLTMLLIGVVAREKAKKNTTWTVTQYADVTGNQASFYSIVNDTDDSLIIVDGGWGGDNTEQVRKVINEHGGKVDAWILTHYHKDHAEAFLYLIQDLKDIKIKQIYVTDLTPEVFSEVAQEWDNMDTYEAYMFLTKDFKNIKKLYAGDTVTVGNLKIDVLSAMSDELIDILGGKVQESDIPNNCSVIFKVCGNEDSMLFLGDAHSPALGEWLISTYGDELRSTYVQAGHHGGNSFPTSFYDAVSPRVMFFDSPEWLMTDPDHSQKDLAWYCSEKGITYYHQGTAPNSVTLK